MWRPEDTRHFKPVEGWVHEREHRREGVERVASSKTQCCF